MSKQEQEADGVNENSFNSSNPFLSAHVAIKPPPFMPKSVSGWLAILEAQFRLARVTAEDTQFFHAVASLPADVVSQLNPEVLASHSFQQLKMSLEGAFSRTKAELFEELLSKTTLVGRPSAFMVELRQTAVKAGAGEDLVRHRFLQALPPTISTALAAQRDLTLEQLGSLADELVPLARSQNCFAVADARQVPFANSRTHPMTAGHGPVGSASARGVQPFHAGQRPQVCRAHLYYGPAARTCRTWCRWPAKPRGLQVLPPSRGSSRASSPVSLPAEQEN